MAIGSGPIAGSSIGTPLSTTYGNVIVGDLRAEHSSTTDSSLHFPIKYVRSELAAEHSSTTDSSLHFPIKYVRGELAADSSVNADGELYFPIKYIRGSLTADLSTNTRGELHNLNKYASGGLVSGDTTISGDLENVVIHKISSELTSLSADIICDVQLPIKRIIGLLTADSSTTTDSKLDFPIKYVRSELVTDSPTIDTSIVFSRSITGQITSSSSDINVDADVLRIANGNVISYSNNISTNTKLSRIANGLINIGPDAVKVNGFGAITRIASGSLEAANSSVILDQYPTTYVQDIWAHLNKVVDGDTQLGEVGRLWYDPGTRTMRVGDGTPGGHMLAAPDFVKIKDTPSSYHGMNDKFSKVDKIGNFLVFSDILDGGNF